MTISIVLQDHVTIGSHHDDRCHPRVGHDTRDAWDLVEHVVPGLVIHREDVLCIDRHQIRDNAMQMCQTLGASASLSRIDVQTPTPEVLVHDNQSGRP